MAQTKNLITREMCKAEMLKKEKHAFILSLLLLIAAIPAFILLGVATSWLANAYSWFFIIYIVLSSLLMILALVSTVMQGVCVAKIKRGAFSLVTDRVSVKTEELVSNGRSRRLEQVLYFVHYGRYLPSETVYQLTDVGDTFYLAVIDSRKPEITLAYHADMYTDKANGFESY